MPTSEFRLSLKLSIARCGDCQLVVYPAQKTCCPRCASADLAPSTADGGGVVWSFTVQRYAPKSPPYVMSPSGFKPFVVAYIETLEGFRVEGIVVVEDPADVCIGHRVVLTHMNGDVPLYRLAEEAK